MLYMHIQSNLRTCSLFSIFAATKKKIENREKVRRSKWK